MTLPSEALERHRYGAISPRPIEPTGGRVIFFFAPGKPAGEPRARGVNRGRHAGVYKKDTPASAAWREMLCIAAEPKRPTVEIERPVIVDISFWMPRPKGLPSRLRGVITPAQWRTGDAFPHPSKPDRDNLDKLVLDTLTQLGFWADDALVFSGTIMKWYAGAGQRPGAMVRIREWEVPA